MAPLLRSSTILEHVCKYLHYKVRFANTSQEIPEFPIPRELALELLMVRKSAWRCVAGLVRRAGRAPVLLAGAESGFGGPWFRP